MDEERSGTIDRRQLRDRVLDRLREEILSGELRSGEFIHQQHIAEQYGVSQMPVREALKELAGEGLVENIPYRGVRVIQYTLNDINDLFALRSFLEGRTAKAAAAFITDEELEHLDALAAKMRVAISSKQETEYRSLNRRFHEIIYRASRSDFFIQTLDRLWSSYPTMLGNFMSTTKQTVPTESEKNDDEHSAIISALRKHDSEAAERLMFAHIQEAGSELLTRLKDRDPKEVPLP